jgi:hypothetical protein
MAVAGERKNSHLVVSQLSSVYSAKPGGWAMPRVAPTSWYSPASAGSRPGARVAR